MEDNDNAVMDAEATQAQDDAPLDVFGVIGLNETSQEGARSSALPVGNREEKESSGNGSQTPEVGPPPAKRQQLDDNSPRPVTPEPAAAPDPLEIRSSQPSPTKKRKAEELERAAGEMQKLIGKVKGEHPKEAMHERINLLHKMLSEIQRIAGVRATPASVADAIAVLKGVPSSRRAAAAVAATDSLTAVPIQPKTADELHMFVEAATKVIQASYDDYANRVGELVRIGAKQETLVQIVQRIMLEQNTAIIKESEQKQAELHAAWVVTLNVQGRKMDELATKLANAEKKTNTIQTDIDAAAQARLALETATKDATAARAALEPTVKTAGEKEKYLASLIDGFNKSQDKMADVIAAKVGSMPTFATTIAAKLAPARKPGFEEAYTHINHLLILLCTRYYAHPVLAKLGNSIDAAVTALGKSDDGYKAMMADAITTLNKTLGALTAAARKGLEEKTILEAQTKWIEPLKQRYTQQIKAVRGGELEAMSKSAELFGRLAVAYLCFAEALARASVADLYQNEKVKAVVKERMRLADMRAFTDELFSTATDALFKPEDPCLTRSPVVVLRAEQGVLYELASAGFLKSRCSDKAKLDHSLHIHDNMLSDIPPVVNRFALFGMMVTVATELRDEANTKARGQ